MFGIGTTELVLLLLIILILFGAGRLGDVARGIGRALHTYRAAEDEVKDALLLGPAKEKEKEPAASTKLQERNSDPR